MSGPQNDFAGKNGYVWFIGVVEGKGDPAKVGRMKVRIIGWHDENTNLLPTEDLPWAQISLPVNGSRNISLPKEGDWVHGFFLDGLAGQQPLIIGVIPGIISKNPKVPTGAADVLTGLQAQLVTETAKLNGMLAGQNDATLKQKRDAQQEVVDQIQRNLTSAIEKLNRLNSTKNNTLLAGLIPQAESDVAKYQEELSLAKKARDLYATTSQADIEKQRAIVNRLQNEINYIKTELDRAPQKGMQDVRTQAQVEAGPRTISGVVTDRKGEPSIPALTRTIELTGRQISNANREHVCDFAIYVKHSMAAARFGTGQIAQGIRKAIQLLIKALSGVPGASAIAEQIKTFARLIKRVADILQEINDAIAVFTTYAKLINQLIQYILSLPAKLLVLFKKCLSEAYAQLAEGVRLIVSDFSGVGGEDNSFGEISGAVQDAINATKELATNAAKLYAAPGQIIGALTNPTTPLSDAEAKALIGKLFPDSEEHDIKSYGALI
jgi:hypothetical protein